MMKINALRKSDIGFDKEQILYVSALRSPISQNYDAFKNEVLSQSEIKNMTAVVDALRGATHEVLQNLTDREQKVLRMRFGIGMNTDHTLEEVGKQFNVTRERIRQIEAKALRKLRHPSRSQKLKTFAESPELSSTSPNK